VKSSFVVYRGPSYLPEAAPGARIVATLTRGSKNAKTGNMAQLTILAERSAPHVAQRTGADAAVCGSCPLRPAATGGCYVNTFRSPLSTWKAAKGRGVDLQGALGYLRASGIPLRLGAYGDPAALPTTLVRALFDAAGGRVTGYTHGWRTRPELARYVMASCETTADARRAHLAGWRTFRATAPSASNLPGEITCPNETRGIECADCLLCAGASRPARSITIPVHGYAARKALAAVA
jgi:hypothetical protein